jgi:hypothetical protein
MAFSAHGGDVDLTLLPRFGLVSIGGGADEVISSSRMEGWRSCGNKQKAAGVFSRRAA